MLRTRDTATGRILRQEELCRRYAPVEQTISIHELLQTAVQLVPTLESCDIQPGALCCCVWAAEIAALNT